MFQKFSRLDGEGSRKRAPGTGVGLSICRSIAEAQGGQLDVASTPGEGATFSFTVPLAAVAPERCRWAGATGSAGAEPGAHRSMCAGRARPA